MNNNLPIENICIDIKNDTVSVKTMEETITFNSSFYRNWFPEGLTAFTPFMLSFKGKSLGLFLDTFFEETPDFKIANAAIDLDDLRAAMAGLENLYEIEIQLDKYPVRLHTFPLRGGWDSTALYAEHANDAIRSLLETKQIDVFGNQHTLKKGIHASSPLGGFKNLKLVLDENNLLALTGTLDLELFNHVKEFKTSNAILRPFSYEKYINGLFGDLLDFNVAIMPDLDLEESKVIKYTYLDTGPIKTACDIPADRLKDITMGELLKHEDFNQAPYMVACNLKLQEVSNHLSEGV